MIFNKKKLHYYTECLYIFICFSNSWARRSGFDVQYIFTTKGITINIHTYNGNQFYASDLILGVCGTFSACEFHGMAHWCLQMNRSQHYYLIICLQSNIHGDFFLQTMSPYTYNTVISSVSANYSNELILVEFIGRLSDVLIRIRMWLDCLQSE